MYVAWLFEYTNNMWYSYMYMYNYLISWEGATPILEVKRPLAKDDNSSEHMHKLLVVGTSYNKSSGCPISVNTTGPLVSQRTGNHDQWGTRGNCGVDESVHLLDLKVFTTSLLLLLTPSFANAPSIEVSYGDDVVLIYHVLQGGSTLQDCFLAD